MAQMFGMLLQEVGEASQQVTPLHGGHPLPVGVVQSLAGGFDSTVDVLLLPIGDHGLDLAGVRIQ
jgi:hypothetical protein